MDIQRFTTNLTLDEIEQRLSGFDNYDLKEKTSEELTANVGSGLKYRFLGVYTDPNYQAPIAIDASDNGDGTTEVELSARAQGMLNSATNQQFFDKGYAELRQALGGPAQ